MSSTWRPRASWAICCRDAATHPKVGRTHAGGWPTDVANAQQQPPSDTTCSRAGASTRAAAPPPDDRLCSAPILPGTAGTATPMALALPGQLTTSRMVDMVLRTLIQHD